MSIFGELDVEDVPDDPFYIEANTYSWVVSKAEYVTYRQQNPDDKPQTQAVYTVSIDDMTSEYHGQQHKQRFTVYDNLKRQEFNELPNDEKIEIKRRMSNHLVWLRGLGLSEADINNVDTDTISELTVGRQFTARLSNNQDKVDKNKIWRNLSEVKPLEQMSQSTMDDWLAN